MFITISTYFQLPLFDEWGIPDCEVRCDLSWSKHFEDFCFDQVQIALHRQDSEKSTFVDLPTSSRWYRHALEALERKADEDAASLFTELRQDYIDGEADYRYDRWRDDQLENERGQS